MVKNNNDLRVLLTEEIMFSEPVKTSVGTLLLVKEPLGCFCQCLATLTTCKLTTGPWRALLHFALPVQGQAIPSDRQQTGQNFKSYFISECRLHYYHMSESSIFV